MASGRKQSGPQLGFTACEEGNVQAGSRASLSGLARGCGNRGGLTLSCPPLPLALSHVAPLEPVIGYLSSATLKHH